MFVLFRVYLLIDHLVKNLSLISSYSVRELKMMFQLRNHIMTYDSKLALHQIPSLHQITHNPKGVKYGLKQSLAN